MNSFKRHNTDVGDVLKYKFFDNRILKTEEF